MGVLLHWLHLYNLISTIDWYLDINVKDYFKPDGIFKEKK